MSIQISSARETIREVIFETRTPAGRAFDIALLGLIVLSLALVSLESVESLGRNYGTLFDAAEWIITGLFTLEFVVRLAVLRRPSVYLFSFFGVVDLISILPTYLAVFFPGAESFLLVRSLRLLRIFRVLKLVYFIKESRVLIAALRNARGKITVFVFSVLSLSTIFGGLMYVIEGPASGFTSIPRGVYWAIVTLTTVGYGDIAPQTPLGQTLAATIMILGYGIIAVPTGIVSVELAEAQRQEGARSSPLVGGGNEAEQRTGQPSAAGGLGCSMCSLQEHQSDAHYCRRCGMPLASQHAPQPHKER